MAARACLFTFSISLSLSAVDLINRKIQYEITLFQGKNVYLS